MWEVLFLFLGGVAGACVVIVLWAGSRHGN